MKRKNRLIILALLLLISTGCGKNNDNKIKRLNVDLKKYDLECVEKEVCKELENKVVQYQTYDGEINGNDVGKIYLTNNGNIYLGYTYQEDKIVKLNGSTKLTHIDYIIEYDSTSLPKYVINAPKSGNNYENPILYGDGKYYFIDDKGNIDEIDFGIENDKILNVDYKGIVSAIGKDNTYVYYYPCKNKTINETKNCKEGQEWIKYTPAKGSVYNYSIKDYNNNILITKENKIVSTPLAIQLNYNTLTYDIYEGIDKDKIEKGIGTDAKKIWGWNSKGIGNDLDNDTLIQYKDNSIATVDISGENRKYNLNEEVQKVFFYAWNILIVGKNNVYIAELDSNHNIEKVEQVDKLKKYRKDIRGYSNYLVLLSDGNFYEIDE